MRRNPLKQQSKEKQGEAWPCVSVLAQGKRGGGGAAKESTCDQSRVMALIVFPNKVPDKRANQHLCKAKVAPARVRKSPALKDEHLALLRRCRSRP